MRELWSHYGRGSRCRHQQTATSKDIEADLKSRKCERNSLRLSVLGVAPTRATMLQEKRVWTLVCLSS